MILPGPSSIELGKKIAKTLNIDIVDTEYKIFSDGESNIRINSDVSNKNIVLIQSTYPPVDQHIIQTLLISRQLSIETAKTFLVSPYFGYSRQDKEFLNGEIISSKIISDLFEFGRINEFMTMDIHSKLCLKYFNIPKYNISAIPILADYIKNTITMDEIKNEVIVISPDLGGSDRVADFSKLLGIKNIVLNKHRDKTTGELTIDSKEIELQNKTVIILDDMISTGGTIIKTSELLSKLGVNKIIAICTHGILLDKAQKKIEDAGVEKIISTNSIPNNVTNIDITPIIVNKIKKLKWLI